MKVIYKTLTALFLFVSIISCTKYKSNFDIDAASARQNALTAKINHQLGDAQNGWLLYIPNLDTAIKTAIPVVLKFDTVKKTFQSSSPFPASTSPIPSFYDVSSATGAPLLSFTSGSIFSSLYESGFISDYYFKILDAGADTIHIQPYRKGLVYASEGGLPMKMIRLKDPFSLFSKLYTPDKIEAALTAANTPDLVTPYQLKLNYTDGYVCPVKTMAFGQISPADEKQAYQSIVPFARDLQTDPIFLFVNGQVDYPIVYYFGDNMLSALVVTLFSGNASFAESFQNGPSQIIQALKTNYLLIKSMDPEGKKIELYAVDVNGKEIISGTLERP